EKRTTQIPLLRSILMQWVSLRVVQDGLPENRVVVQIALVPGDFMLANGSLKRFCKRNLYFDSSNSIANLLSTKYISDFNESNHDHNKSYVPIPSEPHTNEVNEIIYPYYITPSQTYLRSKFSDAFSQTVSNCCGDVQLSS